MSKCCRVGGSVGNRYMFATYIKILKIGSWLQLVKSFLGNFYKQTFGDFLLVTLVAAISEIWF